MGIIIKQTIKGTFWSYLGVVIGFITTAILFTEYLTTDVIGLFSVLLAYSVLFSQISSLGFNGITSRLFPYFRNNKNNHNGFLFIAFCSMLVGFVLFIILFFIIQPYLIESNLEKSKLFADYAWLLIPLTFFTLLFNMLDEVNKLLYNAVFGRFIQEFLQRFLILSTTLLFIFKILSLHQFIIAYVIAVSAKGVIIFFYLLLKNEINLTPQLQFVDKKLKKEMFNVALVSVLAGLGGSVIFQLDKIIINEMLGLSKTGVYTIAFFFGTLVVIPSRTLLKISGTLISDAWKRNDIIFIDKIYKKTCINQFILASLIFGGIWINIDNILEILGPEYLQSKWVIFFIGLAYLIDMATGANGIIIEYSKDFRLSLVFVFILIISVIISLLILVPIWGITGAAISITFGFFINNFMRFIFLFKRYNMQPFNRSFLYVTLIFGVAYLINLIIPKQVLILDIILRSIIFTLLFIVPILLLNISEEMNQIVQKGKRIMNGEL